MSSLSDIAGIVASAATMVAAMMTAANLGARITGYGFVIFSLGSVSWSIVAITTDQTNLLATNIFLSLVNLIGIWRWLGRQKLYEDGAETAAKKSRSASVPTLFTATGFSGRPVYDLHGDAVGKTVEAMIECGSGQLSYVMISSGGIAGVDERLRAVPMAAIDCRAEGLILLESKAEFERRDVLSAEEWPEAASPKKEAGSRQNMMDVTGSEAKHASV